METPTLAEALLNVINDYIEEEELSLAEVLGSLELVKADLLRQAEEDEFDDDDEDADLNKGGISGAEADLPGFPPAAGTFFRRGAKSL